MIERLLARFGIGGYYLRIVRHILPPEHPRHEEFQGPYKAPLNPYRNMIFKGIDTEARYYRHPPAGLIRPPSDMSVYPTDYGQET
jgi:hypothetical protein